MLGLDGAGHEEHGAAQGDQGGVEVVLGACRQGTREGGDGRALVSREKQRLAGAEKKVAAVANE